MISFKKLDERAKIPTRAHTDDAGLDLYCMERVTLYPFVPTKIKTGVATDCIYSGEVGIIEEKSGLASKGIARLGGVIDASYRGDITVCLILLCPTDEHGRPYKHTFEPGDKIAQLVIYKIRTDETRETDIIYDTPRGAAGFGSTGR